MKKDLYNILSGDLGRRVLMKTGPNDFLGTHKHRFSGRLSGSCIQYSVPNDRSKHLIGRLRNQAKEYFASHFEDRIGEGYDPSKIILVLNGISLETEHEEEEYPGFYGTTSMTVEVEATAINKPLHEIWGI